MLTICIPIRTIVLSNCCMMHSSSTANVPRALGAPRRRTMETGPELDRCQRGGFHSCRLPRWRYVSSPVPRCSDLTTSSTTARLLLLSPGRASRWMLSRCEVRCLGAAARPRGYGTAPMQEASRWAVTPTAKVPELSNTLQCCHCSVLSYCIKGSHVLSGRARSET